MSQSPSRRRSADDRFFRLGTGFFALLVVLIVAGIAWVLWRQSRLSIAKFGLSFWKGTTWDPVAGDFGALPFIWGTLYSSAAALVISTPIALGIAIFLSELSPRPLRTPLAFLTELLAAVPSIPVQSLALLVGIEKFMSECRALTNVVGNGVATLVVSRWQGELNVEHLRATMSKRGENTEPDSA